METENYEVENDAVKATLRAIAAKIGPSMPPGWGFNLMIFEYGKLEGAGSLFYIGSAEREDTIKMMKEWIARNEAAARQLDEQEVRL